MCIKPGSIGAGLALALGVAFPTAWADEASERKAIDEIVVTAAGFQQNVADAPASITVIPALELQSRPVRDLADALSMVEGVDVGAPLGKSGGRSISLRGMPADYTLMLVDGRRQDAAGNVTPNGFSDTRSSFMPPAIAIERIEVVRGPMSTLYGADAMGGVVNVITRTPTDYWGGEIKVDGTIQGDSDFGNDTNTTLYLDGPLVPGKLAIALRGRKYQRDESRYQFKDVNGNVIEDGGVNGGARITELDINSLGARLTFTPADGHRIWFDADKNEQIYDNSEGQLGTLGVRGGYEDELQFNREQYTLAYTGEVWGGYLDADLSRNTTETIGRLIPNLPLLGKAPGSKRHIEATNDILNLKFYRSINNHIFTVGAQYWEAEMIEGLVDKPFEHEQSAVFFEDEWRLLDPLALTIGARYDHHSVFGSHVSPRAYLVFDATDSITVKGGVSRGYKSPTLDQLAVGVNGVVRQGHEPTVGNPDLDPETSTNYEIGIYYNNGMGFTANATIYRNNFEDKIARSDVRNCSYGVSETDYQAGNYSRQNCVDIGYIPTIIDQNNATIELPYFRQQANIDEAITQGLELAAKFNVTETVSTSLSYTYTDSEQKSGPQKGEALTEMPRHRITSGVTWHATDDLSLWLRGEYNSKRSRGADRTQMNIQNQLGEYKSYALFNMGGSYVVSENINLSATIYNLANKSFVDEYSPYLDGGALKYASAYSIVDEGRRLWVSLSISF